MHPRIEILSLHLSTYGVAYGLAIFVAGAVSYRRLVRGGVAPRQSAILVLLMVWGGIIGSYVGRGVVGTLRALIVTGELVYLGGSAFMGALVGGVGTFVLLSRRYGLSLGRACDLGLLSIPLGQAIGRLGCLARGCCYGQLTSSWLGMCLPDVSGTWLTRYPTQLLSAVADLLIYLVLLGVEREREGSSADAHSSARWLSATAFEGSLFLLYVALYSAKRFAVEFLRADFRPVAGPFSVAHFGAAGLFTAAVAMIAYQARRATFRGSVRAQEAGVVDPCSGP